MDRLERLADLLAIQELNAAFAYHLDHGEITPLVALFTDDARYSNGARVSSGKVAIEAFYRGRAEGGVRTSRHLYSGLRIRLDGADQAGATSVWMSFAQNAAPPIDYSVPFLVADFIDAYRRGQDGVWRISSREIRPIFRDPNGVPPAPAREGAA